MKYNRCKCGEVKARKAKMCLSCYKKSVGSTITKKTMGIDEGLKPYQKHGIRKSYEEYVEEDKKINPNHHNNKYF